MFLNVFHKFQVEFVVVSLAYYNCLTESRTVSQSIVTREILQTTSLYLPSSLQVTSTVSTTTCCDYLNTEASRRSPTTCSWVTTWTEGSSPSRPYAYCWPTRSSIQRTSFSSGATTSVPPSTESTVSTMSVSTVCTCVRGRQSGQLGPAVGWV